MPLFCLRTPATRAVDADGAFHQHQQTRSALDQRANALALPKPLIRSPSQWLN
jgi:hypothetical protein